MPAAELSPAGTRAIAATRAWVEHAVVGLNLCPFAKAPMVKGQIRYVVSETDDPRELLDALCAQMRELVAADPAQVETTLLIHQNALLDFLDFNDFLGAADAALEDLGLEGVLQIASFHPDYCFADAEPDDLGNASNRSPHPTLHLLREASVERAAQAFPEAEAIFENNVNRLEALGVDGWKALSAAWLD
ncbi:MAG TPA: DUF1415 domain-containing protein [Burkholderiaceae bacterium]|jgi:hypothetical protein